MKVKNLYKKLNIVVFGELETFKGDIFYWVVDWGTMLYRTTFHRVLSTISFYHFIIGLFVFITYAVLTKPQPELFAEYLSIALIMAYFAVSYNMAMRNFDTIQEGVKNVGNLILKARPISQGLRAEALKFSMKSKKIATLCLCLVALLHIVFMIFANKEKNIAFIIVRNAVLDKTVPKILIFFLFVPHGVLFLFTPFWLITYFLGHICLNLQALNEQIDMLIEFEADCDDISKYRNSELYQELINKNLKYFSWVFNKLKISVDFFNDVGKWNFLILYGIGASAISCVFIFIIVHRSQETIPYFGIFLLGIVIFYILSETGTAMQNLNETFCDKLQNLKWYQYNKSNCKIFLVLVLQVRETLSFNCYGFVVQDRQILLKLYRMIHSYTTYYQSVKAN